MGPSSKSETNSLADRNLGRGDSCKGRCLAVTTPKDKWIETDFNGILEPGLLCLAHSDTVVDAAGITVALRSGMLVTAFDLDADEEGKPDRILATGVVEASPHYARCRSSKWCLRVDEAGVQWESQL